MRYFSGWPTGRQTAADIRRQSSPPRGPRPFSAVANVTLSAAGYGYCTIVCPSGLYWETDLLSVSTNAPATAVQPLCKVYRDSAPNPARYQESTQYGNGRTSDSRYGLEGGDPLTAEWTGGLAGAIATFRIRGMQRQV